MIKNILLIESKSPDFNIYSMYKLPRIGLVILGTLAKQAGYNVRILYQEINELRREHILWADLVGFSILTATAPEGFRLARQVQSLDSEKDVPTPIVFGGVHATFCSEECLNSCDYVIRGEAEKSFVPFLDALNGTGDLAEIRGLCRNVNGEVVENPGYEQRTDMNLLPVPDWTLVENYRPRIGAIMTSRGCPYDCSFCSVTAMLGRKYRMRSVDNVMKDLAAMNTKGVFFYDDHFTANRKRTKELLNRIISERGLTHNIKRFSAQVRADIANDPELLDLMQIAGFKTLYIGFESVNPETLALYNKKQTVKDIKRSIEEIHKRKIRIHGMFVFGSDADTLETFKTTMRFSVAASLESVQFLILTPFPGTRQYDQFCSEKRILSTDWSEYDAFNTVFKPKNMTPYQLQKGMLESMRKFYSILRTLKWLIKGGFTVAGIRLYGLITLSLWKLVNRKKLRFMNRNSRLLYTF